MIVSALILTISAIVTFLFAWVPIVEELPEWSEPLTENIGLVSALSGLPLIGVWVQIALLVASVMLAWQAVVFTDWVIRKLRGSG